MHIINNCIDQKIFPYSWKVAKVCPIPKVDHPTSIEEYRPISVLPVLSKVYERVILHQLCAYIDNATLYNTTQSGFRKGHSTSTILLKIRDDIIRAMNRSEVTLAILIDYSKAFDTIEHELLLTKLLKLGFSVDAIKILHSYLTDRNQYVQIDDKSSSLSSIFFGVPQGSILGPVLFNLYVQDLNENVTSASIQYADDTTLYRSCKPSSIVDCTKLLEHDLDSLAQWSSENNLVFNNKKTKSILFKTSQLSRKHQLNNLDNLEIKHKNLPIERTTCVKLLGVHLDENLNWKDHVINVVKACCSTLRTLRLFKRFTPLNVRKTLAEALVLSKINYCNIVYSQVPVYLINRLQRIQNTTAGYVLNKYANINDVISLNWLPINENIQFSTVKMTYLALHDPNWPKYLSVELEQKKRNLRKDNEMLVTRGETNTFRQQCRIFNELPKSIRCANCYNTFRSESKKYFIDKALAKNLSTQIN